MKKPALTACGLFLVTSLFAQTWQTGTNTIYISPTTTKVGIGTSTPGSPLDVNGTVHAAGFNIDEQAAGAIGGYIKGAANADANLVLQANAGGGNAFWLTADPYTLKIGHAGGAEDMGMINCMFGNTVGINTTDTKGYTFAVAGSAVFTQAVVKLQANWPDYVFQPGYHVPALDSIADYIKTNKHLPGIPTTEDVQQNGIDLGATQARLLEKIEQLTLYTIDLQKQVETLKARNRKIDQLEQEIEALKAKTKNL